MISNFYQLSLYFDGNKDLRPIRSKMNPKFWLKMMFLVYRIGILDAIGQCHLAEYSIGGMFLRGHTFKTYRVVLPKDCHFKCLEELICQSYNFVGGQNLCELNNRTKEARPKDFVSDRMRFYVKRVIKRGTFKIRIF